MLKKIILTLALVAFAANSYAALTVGVPGGITFVPSKSVSLGYEGAALTSGSKVVYHIASKHSAGDKEYGATSASSAIGYKAANPGSAVGTTGPGLPSTISDSALAGYSVL